MNQGAAEDGERYGKRIELNAAQEEFLSSIISYVCANGDITKETVVNESPFDEKLEVFKEYMAPLAKYIDNLHLVAHPIDNPTIPKWA